MDKWKFCVVYSYTGINLIVFIFIKWLSVGEIGMKFEIFDVFTSHDKSYYFQHRYVSKHFFVIQECFKINNRFVCISIFSIELKESKTASTLKLQVDSSICRVLTK